MPNAECECECENANLFTKLPTILKATTRLMSRMSHSERMWSMGSHRLVIKTSVGECECVSGGGGGVGERTT